jgi:hypothetical protein
MFEVFGERWKKASLANESRGGREGGFEAGVSSIKRFDLSFGPFNSL